MTSEEYALQRASLREHGKNLGDIENSAMFFQTLQPEISSWAADKAIAMFEFDNVLKRGLDGGFLSDSILTINSPSVHKDYDLTIEFYCTDFGFDPNDYSGNYYGQPVGIGNPDVAPFAVHKYNSNDDTVSKRAVPTVTPTDWKTIMQNNQKALNAFTYDTRTSTRKIYAIVYTNAALNIVDNDDYTLTLSIGY